MNHIPIHRLYDRASIGLEIHHANHKFLKSDQETLQAHRDDHYIFFIIEEGEAGMMIDFAEIHFRELMVYYVLPGQVHHRLSYASGKGWFIAVDALLVPAEYRSIFENNLFLQQPRIPESFAYRQCLTAVRLLYAHYRGNPDDALYLSLLHSLLNSFLGLIAREYAQPESNGLPGSRPTQIARQFKQLLAGNVLTLKQPAAYADMLHITESYLNEVLKKVTGFSVTYWVLNAVMLEAKRLLYYTELNVKEVAYSLGYEDHTYFSRLFKKTVQLTPLEFRGIYRK